MKLSDDVNRLHLSPLSKLETGDKAELALSLGCEESRRVQKFPDLHPAQLRDQALVPSLARGGGEGISAGEGRSRGVSKRLVVEGRVLQAAGHTCQAWHSRSPAVRKDLRSPS